MARAKGPLFSIEATGALGKTVIYQNQNGQAVVKMWAKPKNPKSAAQKQVRLLAKYLSAQWQHLTPEEQSSWLDCPAQKNIGAYHRYLGENMRRENNGLGMSIAYPATNVPMPDLYQNGPWSDDLGHLTIQVLDDQSEVMRGYYILAQQYDWTHGEPWVIMDWHYIGWWTQDELGVVYSTVGVDLNPYHAWQDVYITTATGWRRAADHS